jgi:hypothetical protein
MDALRTLEILITSRTPLFPVETLGEETQATKPLSVTRAEEVGDRRELARGRAGPAS